MYQLYKLESTHDLFIHINRGSQSQPYILFIANICNASIMFKCHYLFKLRFIDKKILRHCIPVNSFYKLILLYHILICS